MITGVKPTRQEMTEISTATLEGADSFMLTHETSIGKMPIDATTCLAKAVAEAESIFDYE
jgi:pyruvate kinase